MAELPCLNRSNSSSVFFVQRLENIPSLRFDNFIKRFQCRGGHPWRSSKGE